MMLNMKLLVSVLGLIFYSSLVAAKDGDAKIKQERDQLLTIMNSYVPPKFVIEYEDFSPLEASEFLKYYIEDFSPTLDRLMDLRTKLSSLHLLLDRALHESEEQQEDWKKLRVLYANEFDSINFSSDWKTKVKTLYLLTEGLEGPLVDFAKNLYDEEIRFNLDDSFGSLNEELIQIDNEVQRIANTSKHIEEMHNETPERQKLFSDFMTGKINFEQAHVLLKTFRGGAKYANDVSTQGKDLFQRQAVIFSIFAKAKGFKNRADFQIAESAEKYSQPFQTVEGQLEFLESFLKSTDEVYEKLHTLRMSQLGLDSNLVMDQHHNSLLSFPDSPEIRHYFLKENFLEIWQSTMEQSGFSKDAFDTINIDADPRPGKFPGAYLLPVQTKKPKTIFIDAVDMTADLNSSKSKMVKPQVFWLQSDVTDGIDALGTTFHEGGHALDFVHRLPHLIEHSSESYNETHSSFMEKFLIDREFLLTHGKNKSGEPVPSHLVDSYLENKIANDLKEFRGQVAMAIFDLKLWNYDYETGTESFVERGRRLYSELNERALLFKGQNIDDMWWQDAFFSTPHFYSGRVGYLGYIAAEMAADSLLVSLLDHFEKTTGRRSIYNQPELANILIENFYKNGHSLPFPQALENFTGQKLDGNVYAQKIIDDLSGFLQPQTKDCRSFLSN